MGADGDVASKPWTWRMYLWKSRLPLLAVPLLSGLCRLSRREDLRSAFADSAEPGLWEYGLVCAIAAATGYLRLPFSVTWWLMLIAAFAVETHLVVGVATIMSLSVLFAWYGVRVSHPQAVSALWGGTRSRGTEKGAGASAGMSPALWQLWDLVVHLLPACAMLYWYGPQCTGSGIAPGLVDVRAAMLALPLNLLWLWALGLSLPARVASKGWLRQRRIWPFGMGLSETNIVYRVAPELPWRAWRWIYGSHWSTCIAWTACLLLPRDAVLAYAIFVVSGFIWMPFTNAWWFTFLIAVFVHDGPFFRGMVACSAATTAIGWYGTRFLLPYVFKTLLNTWIFKPTRRWAPASVASAADKVQGTAAFLAVARLADLFVHLIPTMTAVLLFAPCVTAKVALASFPCNLMYWVATGGNRLADTNKIYGVDPEPPDFLWTFIFGSHCAFCLTVAGGCAAWQVLA